MLRDPQATHAAVLGAIVEQPVNERVLWRLAAPTRHRAELLVLSQSHPSFEHIVEQAGYPSSPDGSPLTRDLAGLLSMLEIGRRFSFRLTANPTRSVRSTNADETGTRARGRRVGHVTANQQLQWFTERLPRAGFKVCVDDEKQLRALITSRRRLRFDKGGQLVTLQLATFDAVVEVLDATAAREAMVGGIGAAKAYGCGLVTLAPVAR